MVKKKKIISTEKSETILFHTQLMEEANLQ